MAFRFFRGKQSGPREIACPLCDHRQTESPLAVSSYCKGCGAYLTFQDGKIKARPKTVENPFENRPPQPKVEINYTARLETLHPFKTPPAPPVEPPTPVEEKEEATPALIEESEPAPTFAPPVIPPPPAIPTIVENSKSESPFPDDPPSAPTLIAEPESAPEPDPAPVQAAGPLPLENTESATTIPLTLPIAPGPVDESGPATTLPVIPPAPPAPIERSGPTPAPVTTPPSPPAPIESAPLDEPAPRPAPPKAESPKSFLDKKPSSKPLNTRRAVCFECGDAHEANALSNSTQCRKCGRMISLANHDIKGPWSSRIQTRGDVFIHKKGIVTGATIQCHHMIVEGDFTGSVECSGDLTLRRHGKIMGKVTCDRLLVEKRAKVDFLNPVETNECRIDGLVSGNIDCHGRLALEKKATLTGNIKVGTLTVADGAKHSGQIQMGRF
ncbi:polymer-forming cytoskeletal protein [Verrucomicrobiaceae bacterium 227]